MESPTEPVFSLFCARREDKASWKTREGFLKHRALLLSLCMDNVFFSLSFTLGTVFWKFSRFNGESKSLGTDFMFLGTQTSECAPARWRGF